MIDWDAVGAIGEIVGAVAVVVSILYLAGQIGTQNREARRAALHEVYTSFRDALSAFRDPNLSVIWVKAKDDFESLEEHELLQFLAAAMPALRTWEEAFIQYEEGLIEERSWNALTKNFVPWMGVSSYQKIWEERKILFDPGFREYVDNIEVTEFSLRQIGDFKLPSTNHE